MRNSTPEFLRILLSSRAWASMTAQLHPSRAYRSQILTYSIVRYSEFRNIGKNRTLSHREWSQRSEFTMFNTLVLAPNVVSGEIDVFPAER